MSISCGFIIDYRQLSLPSSVFLIRQSHLWRKCDLSGRCYDRENFSWRSILAWSSTISISKWALSFTASQLSVHCLAFCLLHLAKTLFLLAGLNKNVTLLTKCCQLFVRHWAWIINNHFLEGFVSLDALFVSLLWTLGAAFRCATLIPQPV